MVNYRRDKSLGGTYFFTLVLANRKSKILTKYIRSLGCSLRRARNNNSFVLKAIVVLPEHLHMIMGLPENDFDYSTRIRHIKTYFVQELLSSGAQLTKNHRAEYNLWQSRFWEHRIRNDADFEAHVNYIHFNPVKHGLVKNAIDWPYSSFHRYVRNGIYSTTWGVDLGGMVCGEFD